MREAARRRSTCQNNVVRLMIALQNYQSRLTESLPRACSIRIGPIRKRGLSVSTTVGWSKSSPTSTKRTRLSPHRFLGRRGTEHQNAPVRKLRLAEFICPSELIDDLAASSYAGCHNDVEALIDANNQGSACFYGSRAFRAMTFPMARDTHSSLARNS